MNSEETLLPEGNGNSSLETAEHVAFTHFAPRTHWSEMSPAEHFVQFYEADGFLLSSLSGFIRAAINSGDAALVLATKSHREGLDHDA